MIRAAADYTSFQEGWRAGAIVVGAICLAVGAVGHYLAARWWRTFTWPIRRRAVNRELDRILPRTRKPAGRPVMPRRGPFDQDRP